MQEMPQGERPVQYLSQQFTPAEQKYATIEKETLEAKCAIETLCYYLWGVPFTAATNHVPLAWLQQMKVTNPGLTQLYFALQPYSFIVKHHWGHKYTNAEFFSRQMACEFLGERACSDVCGECQAPESEMGPPSPPMSTTGEVLSLCPGAKATS